ncbi:hypothetical protein [Parendozoicomonas haliclonae]|uniref:Uncharacterized protein n=1 Tax=Parendozoicomonas haliclonae TaxID=1960125 RepID=A0A1X7AI92_9GAMM|nr:hypothetical protein [Parendozoicomonas haliclonae]SMA43093.1 hypothetical protein EHSB41UT_01553 [Parendozoicomonas haliclonae]
MQASAIAQDTKKQVVVGEPPCEATIPGKSKGRKTYLYERGYCYIPKAAWTAGLEKQPGQKVPFYVSSLRHALIIPAGYCYPHLTLDIQETRFIKLPAAKGGSCVAVRINHMHLSPAENVMRIPLLCRGQDVYPEYPGDERFNLQIQGYLAQTPLPYWIAVAAGPSNPPLVRPLLPSSELPDLPPLPSELPNLPALEECPRRKQARGKRKGKGKGKKEKGEKKAGGSITPAKKTSQSRLVQPVTAKADPDTVWREHLQINSFLEGLDTLDLELLSDPVLEQAVKFYQLIKPAIRARLDRYGCKVKERSQAVMDALGDSARLSKAAMEQVGRSRQRFLETAMAKTQREVVRAIKVGELQEDHDPDALDMLDFGLHNLVPDDLLPSDHSPSPEQKDIFAGYRAALLLGVKEIAMECQEVRSTEHFGRAFFLNEHLGHLFLYMAPALRNTTQPLSDFMNLLLLHLGEQRDNLVPENIQDGKALKTLHRRMDTVHGFSEVGILLFNGYATRLGEISTTLSRFQERHWAQLPGRIKEPLARFKGLHEEEQTHWWLCSDILQEIADISADILRG